MKLWTTRREVEDKRKTLYAFYRRIVADGLAREIVIETSLARRNKHRSTVKSCRFPFSIVAAIAAGPE